LNLEHVSTLSTLKLEKDSNLEMLKKYRKNNNKAKTNQDFKVEDVFNIQGRQDFKISRLTTFQDFNLEEP